MTFQANGSMRRRSWFDVLRRLLKGTEPPPANPEDQPPAPPQFRNDIGIAGRLKIGTQHIIGRVYRPDRLDERLTLALYDGERFLRYTTADREHPDLIRRGIGDGKYRFSFSIPPSVRDGRPHELDIRIAGTAQSVLTRPLDVCFEPNAPSASPASTSMTMAKGKVNGEPTTVLDAAERRVPQMAAGRAEAQSEQFDEAAAMVLIASSPLFDRAWYLAQYPAVARLAIDPALHYLREGGAKRFKPSIYFDPDYYLDGAPELVAAGANPLLHYLTVGRAQGRRPLALLEVVPRPPAARDAAIVEAPPGLHPPEIEWIGHAALAGAAAKGGVFFCGTFLGPAGATVSLSALSAYCRLTGLDPAQATRTRAPSSRETPAEVLPADNARCFGPALSTGQAQLGDAWFTDERTVRLRLGQGDESGTADRIVVRGYQGSAADPAALTLCGEALIPAIGPGFVDLTLGDGLLPALIVLAGAQGEIREFGLLPFPSLLRGGLHYAELIATAERPSPIDDLRRYSDMLLREIAAGPAGAIGRIVVRRQGAIGAERIFSRSVVDWLARIFGVRLELEAGNGEDLDGADAFLRERLCVSETLLTAAPTHGEATLTLSLTADAVPTLAALTARRIPLRTAAAVGPFLVAEAPSGRPRWSVALPPMDEALLALQPNSAALAYPVIENAGPTMAGDTAPETIGLHLAVRHCRFAPPDEAALTMPQAPDARIPTLRKQPPPRPDAVAALILCTDATRTVRLLESLASQTAAPGLRVRLCVGPDAAGAVAEIERALERLFPRRGSLIPASGLFERDVGAALRDASAPFLLVVRDGIVAPDPHTLETLLALANEPRVASASCVVLRETLGTKAGIRFHSGGYFPSHVSFLAAPHLILTAPDCLNALPAATYPVIGNQLDFALLSVAAAASFAETEPSSFGGARPDVAFALHALAAGDRHLCTSAVRVIATDDAPPAEITAPLAGAFIRPERWESILSRVTVLRELR